jgi:molybdopterin synthase catalytic subunit
MGYARLQAEPFSLDAALKDLTHERAGGITLYVGTVRGREGDRTISSLTYEAFPEMAQESLERLRQDTVERFHLVDALVIHRIGRLQVGEPILLVALAGAHRGETYDAVRHFMDQLKRLVPIWKREEGPEGTAWILGAEGRRVKA